MKDDWRFHVGPRPRPPWWPYNEPWPPRFGRRWRHRRTRFERRFIALVWIAVFLIFAAANTLLSWLFPGIHLIGPSIRSVRPLFLLFWIFVILTFVIPAIRRFGAPLGEIVEAADRVADGDYSARVSEYGPGWMRTIASAFNSMTNKLQSQDQQRRDLMADIAHELRNPLAALQGRLEGMLDGVYPRDEAQINAVLQETQMLTRLVEDLRTLAHSESGMLALQKESTDMGMLVNDAAASCAADAAERQVTLDVQTAPDLPLMEVDPLRIREVLTNLISNALRHTPEGGCVTVAAIAKADSIVVSVGDTGSGIPAGELPKIFDRFYKGRASRGSGLGLTIARNLVVAHGGEIHADSVEGKGTVISIRLPPHPRQS
jgi:two-component system OmpR family sensor kinase/two-component system sensor histidine kinase BaeS